MVRGRRRRCRRHLWSYTNTIPNTTYRSTPTSSLRQISHVLNGQQGPTCIRLHTVPQRLCVQPLFIWVRHTLCSVLVRLRGVRGPVWLWVWHGCSRVYCTLALCRLALSVCVGRAVPVTSVLCCRKPTLGWSQGVGHRQGLPWRSCARCVRVWHIFLPLACERNLYFTNHVKGGYFTNHIIVWRTC